MTPRQADIVHVLEGIAGVEGVYAFLATGDDFDMAVRLAHGTRLLAEVHYALLRAITHMECRRILLIEDQLAVRLAARTVRLELTPAERETARARVRARTSLAPEPPAARRIRSGAPFAALIVDRDVEVYRAVVTALGVGARRVVEPGPLLAAEHALAEEFDLILCSGRSAFGRLGFLHAVQRRDSAVAARVVITAALGERGMVRANLDALGCYNACVSKPLDTRVLLDLARTACTYVPFEIPLPSPRARLPSNPPLPSTRPHVLVIDDDTETHVLVAAMGQGPLRVTVTADVWEALDAIAAGPPDLILCSASLRAGATPHYRVLWSAHPELKARFVLVVPGSASPPSANPAQSRAFCVRPLTLATVQHVLAGISGAKSDPGRFQAGK